MKIIEFAKNRQPHLTLIHEKVNLVNETWQRISNDSRLDYFIQTNRQMSPP